jgi:precorrin-2 dehydrogenase/sirohydrochlorin ferrochelatase
MKTYPIMLNVVGRRCVVVGGGKVGLRKVASLVSAGAKVRLVSAHVDAHADLAGVEIVTAAYDPAHLAGAVLVFACTDDPKVNSQVCVDARRAGVPINVVDIPHECDFFAPATFADGDVILAVGTGGSAPALAGRLAGELARHLPPRIGEYAAALDQVRQWVHQAIPDLNRRMAIMKSLVAQPGYEAFLAGGVPALMAMAKARPNDE